ncbi:hypothetical protein [uncultured Selenomonas sp.]|uniref:hypothetical protein n=1 Tax=uncultured Selenomonas sp. TaxID=159275 RepID=UPI0028D7D6E4|nr:hypothetical protein [uncultured Selenomonas sp.]
MFNRMQIAVLMGIVLGIGTPLAAMTLETHKTEAAVAVFDQKNIEEAIKTAVQTANILTTEQKELALMILDAKKLDFGMLQKWGQKNKDAGGWCKTPDLYGNISVLKSQGKTPSILNVNTTVKDIFKNEIGTIEDAMTGKKTLVDLYLQTQKNHKALDATYQAAAERAQASQKVTDNTNETVKEAVEAAGKAEGQQQIMQAQIQIAAAGVVQQTDMKDLLAQMLAMESQKWYVENTEKAAAETRDRAVGQRMRNFVGN